MEERTRKWVNLFEHMSFDPVDHYEDESIDYGDSEIYYDTQTEANDTIDLENMKERTRQRIDLVRHEPVEPLLTSGTEVIQNKAKATR